MKKIVAIISFILILTTLVSCSKKVEYTMYVDHSAGVSSATDSSKLKYPVKSADEKVFSFAETTEISKPSKVEDTKKLTLLGVTYDLDYRKSFTTAISASEKLGALGSYNEYYREALTADFNANGNLAFFLDFNATKENDGDFTQEAAIEKAKELIKELYGDDVSKRYEYSDTIVTDNNGKEYLVVYENKVHGYRTMDIIQISFSSAGKLISVNANNIGTMATAENDLKKSEIENAIKAINDNYSDEWDVSDSYTLIVDSNGDYYIRGGVSKKNESGSVIAMQVYTNIK